MSKCHLFDTNSRSYFCAGVLLNIHSFYNLVCTGLDMCYLNCHYVNYFLAFKKDIVLLLLLLFFFFFFFFKVIYVLKLFHAVNVYSVYINLFFFIVFKSEYFLVVITVTVKSIV